MIPYKQLSLADIFENCQEIFEVHHLSRSFENLVMGGYQAA